MYTSLLQSTYQSTSTCHRCTNAFALAQDCHKTELHLTWKRGALRVSKFRGSSSSKVCTGMVTTTGSVTLWQQLRLEVVHIIQQVRTELHETVSGMIDMLNSTNTALRNVTVKPAPEKPYRIRDLIQGKWRAAMERASSDT